MTREFVFKDEEIVRVGVRRNGLLFDEDDRLAGGTIWLVLKTVLDTVYLHLTSIQDGHLHVAITGSYGCYAFEWWSTGRKGLAGAVAFAAGLTPDYLLGKLCGAPNVFRSDETCRRLRKKICRARLDREFSRDAARGLWDRVDDAWSLEEFNDFASDADSLFDFGIYSCAVFGWRADAEMVVRAAWPRLMAIPDLQRVAADLDPTSDPTW